MVAMAEMDDIELNLPALFYTIKCLDETGIVINKKMKPHMSPGTILGMRFNDRVRGLFRTDGKNFKNAIITDMSIKDKNINIRVCSSMIHMAGAKSINHFNETLVYMKEKITKLNNLFKYVSDNREEAREVCTYLSNVIRSHYDYNPNRCPIYLDVRPDHLNRFNKEQCRMIKICARFLAIIDTNTGVYANQNTTSYINDVKWLLLENEPMFSNLHMGDVMMIMINKNYELGFTVLRNELARIFSQYPKFTVRCDPAINAFVRIDMPFEIEEGSKIHRKKSRGKSDVNGNKHVFIVYRSGSVTQTGPSLELMQEAYNEFMKIIVKIRHLIENVGNNEHVSMDESVSHDNSTNIDYSY